MDKRLVIIGAGGHGKVVADIALKIGYKNICFVDDRANGDVIGIPVIATTDELDALNDGNTEFIIAVGNNALRKKIAEKVNLPWATLIHPSAQVGCGVEIGKGTVVMACVVVNVCAVVGEHCIVNTAAVVEHDNSLEDYVHISPGVCLGGTVQIGECTHIGIGACVRNNISICENCIVGAGAAVVSDICESGVYVGVPARIIREMRQ